MYYCTLKFDALYPVERPDSFMSNHQTKSMSSFGSIRPNLNGWSKVWLIKSEDAQLILDVWKQKGISDGQRSNHEEVNNWHWGDNSMSAWKCFKTTVVRTTQHLKFVKSLSVAIITSVWCSIHTLGGFSRIVCFFIRFLRNENSTDLCFHIYSGRQSGCFLI